MSGSKRLTLNQQADLKALIATLGVSMTAELTGVSLLTVHKYRKDFDIKPATKDEQNVYLVQTVGEEIIKSVLGRGFSPY